MFHNSLSQAKIFDQKTKVRRTGGGPNLMAYNEPTGNYSTTLFTKEVFYLAVGCAFLLAIQWLKEKMFLNESPEKTSAQV
jgi:hypothetical protein